MIKSKRGVSLVVLIATLAIMVLLTTTVTISAAAVSNNAKRVKFATEIAYVQECVNAYNLKNLDSYPVNNSITINLTGVSAKALSQFNNETQTNSQIILYEIDFNLLGKTELKYGNKASNDDVYAVSKDTGKVYYVKGEKIGSDTYFTLTNDLKKVINYVDVSTNQVNKDGIIFLPSTIEWTNQKITADIKVPNNYTAVTVTATQNGSSAANMSISSTNARYNIYTQNTLNSNYEITIMYTDNNISKKQTFNVNNFDSTKPTLTLSTLNSIDSQSQKSNYVKVENTTVGNSGLKVLKYENELIQAHLVPTYFKSNGMNVENNIIKIPYATRNITVYLEDKAGNYTFKTLDVDKLYKDYIKNGLVLHLDGYRNTRSGHNQSAYVWEDLSGNYNDGNLNGFSGISTISGWQNDKLAFDGINDTVTVPLTDNLKVLDQTLEIVIKRRSIVKNDRSIYIETWTGFTMEFNPDNSISYGRSSNGGYLRASELIVLNKVYSIVGCFSNGIQNIYINNKNSGSKNTTPDPYQSAPISIGAYISNYFLDGEIYAIRMYNRQLTQEEINTNYQLDKIRFNLN